MNYYKKLIDFFKRNGIDNEIMFNYLIEKTILIDYSIEEQREIRGAYPKYDKQKRLTDITLYIDVNSDETILLSIRPYIKAICAYYHLGALYKPDKDIEAETLAIYFEKLYFKENPHQRYKEYLDNIYSSIRKEKDTSKHKIALEVESELEKNSSIITCFEELHEKAKTLRLTKNK